MPSWWHHHPHLCLPALEGLGFPEFPMHKPIALLGEHNPSFPPHAATDAAVGHSRRLLEADIDAVWVSTEDITPDLFQRFGAIWVAPGSPYKNLEQTLWAIRQARKDGIPCLGTCGGFQHMVLEYARNALGFREAHHEEYDPYASTLFISELTCSLAGRTMELSFTPGSRVAGIYAALTAKERYYCNFGINPDCVDVLKEGPLQFTGADAEGELRVLELPGHPFFLGTLYVPQARSTAARPHPLVTEFLRAALT
jgi:CTP synthase (UTP-ammonia lyase)